ncbi:MAG: hypothetical protein DRK00_09010 [Thermoprotei archaeon]|nr:MAG: hypothetical protein DRK00_09010 [Thermoprotei archaeon]
MDVTYQQILNMFFRKVEMSKCRIVVDDYGVSRMLRHFLNFLEKQGAEVVVTHEADERYLEVKAASLISKRIREEVIKRINENPEFQVEGLTVGSGNANDPQTLKWLERWHASGREWPWFVKRSFRTVRELENRSGIPEKRTPPIDERLLSKEFLEEFSKGCLSIKSSSVVCPYCGKLLKAVTFAIYKRGGRKSQELSASLVEGSLSTQGLPSGTIVDT